MKKLIGLFTTALLLGNLSVNASTITEQDLVSNAVTASAEVTFSKAASVTITIPERCRLNSGTKTGTYQICVAGEIQPNVRYTVAPRDQSETALADALAALDAEFASLTITDIYVSWSDGAVSNQDVYWGLQSMNPVLHFDTASIF